MSSDNITVFFYTAWNGYSWQGCDSDTEHDLQRYMDATGTLPQSAGERVPFGGAIACIIKGQLGVAVYRYHIRKQGDAFGRDSLYIVLAFIPGGTPLVDFAALLESDVMSSPREGEQLKPITLSPEQFPLVPNYKYDEWVVLSQHQSYTGPSEFQSISVLFQTPYTQLGLPKARFVGTSPQDPNFTAEFSYTVFPEVEKVEAARNALKAKRELRKFVDERDPAYIALSMALEELVARKNKLPGYDGLEDFIKVVSQELKSDDDTLRRLEEFQDKLQRTRNYILEQKLDCNYWPIPVNRGEVVTYLEAMRQRLNQMSLVAKDFDLEKPIDCDGYRRSCKLALQISEEAAQKIQLYDTCKALLQSTSANDIPAVLRLMADGGIDPQGRAFANLSSWAKKSLREWERSHPTEPPPQKLDPRHQTLGRKTTAETYTNTKSQALTPPATRPPWIPHEPKSQPRSPWSRFWSSIWPDKSQTESFRPPIHVAREEPVDWFSYLTIALILGTMVFVLVGVFIFRNDISKLLRPKPRTPTTQGPVKPKGMSLTETFGEGHKSTTSTPPKDATGNSKGGPAGAEAGQ